MTKTSGDYDFLFKLVLIGDSGVGKSCMLLRFCEAAFNLTYKATSGIDFGLKIIDLDGKKIKLQFWDVGGQQKFQSAVPFSYHGRGAKGIMLVYDITNDETFGNIKNWIREIDKHAPSDVVTMLIGSKCDMEGERMVPREKASQLATERGIKFMEVSAKATININEVFYTISRDMLEVEKERLLHPSGMVMAKTLPDYDFLLKFVLIGDPVVGKTCVLYRFSEDAFNLRYKATIGIDFRIKIIKLDGKKIKLQIWDTSGQERFYDAATTYCRDAMGIMLVYDITNDKSFENIKKWFRTIKEHAPSDVVTMLIGNKCDMEGERIFSREMALQFATEHGMKFLEVSAKENINIDEAFSTLARDILAVQERRFLEERERQQSKGFLSSVRGFLGKLGLKSQQTNSRLPSSSQQTLQSKEPEQSTVHERKPPREATAAEDSLLSQSRDAQAKEDVQLVCLGQASQENA